MAWYFYKPMVAVDASGAVVRSGTGQVYAVGDLAATNPLSLQDPNGDVITSVAIDDRGLTQAFRVEAPEVVWRSGPYVVGLDSAQGSREAAEAAAAQAAASAQTMQQMLAEMQKFAVIPHNGSTSGYAEGTIIIRLPA